VSIVESGGLFTWGDGKKGQLGLGGDKLGTQQCPKRGKLSKVGDVLIAWRGRPGQVNEISLSKNYRFLSLFASSCSYPNVPPKIGASHVISVWYRIIL
jgi:hypothetical protein